jgi:hypothetical protein
MDTQFQDLQWVVERAIKQFRANKNRRVSALFRDLKKNPHFALFGDFSMLWAISEAMKKLHLPIHRTQFSFASRQSKEYMGMSRKEKRWWLDTLVQ